MKISVVIPTYNRKKKLARLIKSILKSNLSPNDYEVLVIDDCSTDGTVEYISDLFVETKNFRIIKKKRNTRKSSSVNLGFRKARGEYIFCVDDDTTIAKDTIKVLYEYLEHADEKVMVFPIMYFYDRKGVIWSAGIKMNFWTTTGKFLFQGSWGPVGLPDEIDVDAGVTAFMVSKTICREIGFFNETMFPFQFEELDYCIRARHGGYRLLTVTSSKLWHDHEKGVFLNNPWRLYFEVRNRIISAKLWSMSAPQEIISRFFSVVIPCSYYLIKMLLYRKKYFDSVISISKGIRDGLRLSRQLTPYYSRSIMQLSRDVI